MLDSAGHRLFQGFDIYLQRSRDCRTARPAHFISVSELIPESYVARLDPQAIFGRSAPLEVDLGCGDGSFLSSLAAERPNHNFLGIERLVGRVRTASRKAAKLTNARILRVETAYAVRYLLPSSSVSVFHLLFPDPWPKRRHHERRIFTAEFLEAALTALAPGGCVRIATDQSDYFEQIERIARNSDRLRIVPGNGDHPLPPTTFEKRFVTAGANIYRIEFWKVSPVM